MSKVRGNFIYPEITETDRTYAGAVLGPVLREDGDWRDFLPPDENQRQNGVESSACYVEAQQASVATIQEETFAVVDQNYSARFNALLSKGTENGGDPIKGALSIKKDGLIPEEMMSFKGIDSWKNYHSWEGVNETECRQKGKEFLDRWNLNYKIVAEREEPVETKYASLREALKRSPVPISVCAWYQRGGLYYKPAGKRDNHLTLAIYIDSEDRIHVRDTYSPYLKILEPKTNFEFAMAWTVEKKPYEQTMWTIGEMLKLIGTWIENLIKSKPVDNQKPSTYNEPRPKESRIVPWAKAIETYENANKAWNNPGAIRSASGPFLKFKTYDEGFAYLCDYLTRVCTGKHKAYPKGGEYTLLEFQNIYSPAHDSNDPRAYASFVAKRIGVTIDIKIKELL